MSNYNTDGLLQELSTKGCKVDIDEDSVLVYLPDGSTSFLFERIGSWVHLGSTIIPAEDVITPQKMVA
jgi:hypothetical protein